VLHKLGFSMAITGGTSTSGEVTKACWGGGLLVFKQAQVTGREMR